MGRRRQHRVEICLDNNEYAHLQRQVVASGLSAAGYLRRLILGHTVKPRAPAEWPELVRQVSAIGNNINQLVRVANSEKSAPPEVLREAMHLQAAVWEKVRNL